EYRHGPEEDSPDAEWRFRSDGRSCKWPIGWCWRRKTPASASARRRPAAGPTARQYPGIRFLSGSMRRRRDKDRKTRNARRSAGYALLTSIRSRNATLDRTQVHPRNSIFFGDIEFRL